MNKIEKAMKALGDEAVKALEAESEEVLRRAIVNANEAMRKVDDELEANPKYQEIKESLKAITAGKREVNTRQKAMITVALSILESKGVV